MRCLGKLWRFVAVISVIASILSSQDQAAADTFSEPGFATERVATLSPYSLVGMTFAPDGRLFVWQKNGVVRVIKNGQLLPTPFIDLSAKVNTYDDRGFWGLAFDPQFASNGRVYLSYTFENAGDPNSSAGRTSRLTRVNVDPANPDTALPGSEVVIMGSVGTPPCSLQPASADCIAADSGSHTIGSLHFASDGMLFVGVGDGADAGFVDPLSMRSQDLDSPNGKILRIRPDGTAPSDNPFYDGTNSWRSKVWQWGVRNPFGFSLHPETEEVFLGDVGWHTWEEVNHGPAGTNFGWPCYEGTGQQASYQLQFAAQCAQLPPSSVTPPYYTYDHGSGSAVIGGPFYTGTVYPQGYWDNFFFADYSGNWIRRVVLDAEHQPTSVQTFATGVEGPVSLSVGPDGLIYYLSFTAGEVRRIRYNGPVATASAAPTYGYSPLSVSFSSAGSSNPGGGPLTYLWQFGDGTTSTAANPSHTYTAGSATTFTARLTVTNQAGLSSTDVVPVTVGSVPPTPAIQTPADGTTVLPGQTVTYQGSASDADDGALPPSALKWTVLLHHNTHVHTFVAGTGSQGSFVAQNHGSVGSFQYEVILTATDSSGLKSSTSVTLPVGSDTSPPTDPASLTATAVGSSRIDLAWPASTDNVSVSGYRVERCQGAGCTDFTEVGTPATNSYSDTGLAPSNTYRYRVRAIDPSGNLSGYSPLAGASTGEAPPTPAGLIGAWGFEEGAGPSAADSSGSGNTGTLIGAAWTTQGRYGGALSFNGANSVVRVADSPSLDLSSAMTLSAWIRPSAAQSGWRTILQRETDAYFLNASNTDGPLRPSGGGTFGGSTQYLSGPNASPVDAWTHVALSYDGSTLLLFINGTQVAARAMSGSIQNTANPLWIGGNSPYGEYFQGLIDEVRVYGRALAQSEIQADMNAPIVPTGSDTSPPTDPASLTATAVGSSRIDLAWPASTDNVSVSGYRVERCQGAGCTDFTEVGTPATNSYSDTGLAPSNTYRYRVRAIDPSGNLSGYSPLAGASTGEAPPTPAGLIGAWGFEEGAGPSAADSSGSGNTGTLIGAAWTTQGRYGGALSFNGANSVVRVADSPSLDLSSAMTLSAWIRPSAAQSGWRTILQRETDAYFLNASNTDGPLRPSGGGTFGGSTQYLSGPNASPVDAWTHVALSYDGSTLLLFINGTQVAARAMSGSIQNTANPLWIGGNSPYGEYFQGLIDEVRVYGRALAQSEIQADMNAPIVPTGSDTSPPTDPASLTATAVGSSRIDLAWPASTDNVSVSGYRVERCQGAGCTDFTEVGTPATNSYSDTGLAPSNTYRYRVRAIDPSGNLSGYSPLAGATTPDPPDGTPPTEPTGLSATAISTSRIDLSWTASTDNVGVTGYLVERCQGAGCTNFAQVATPTANSHSDTGLAPSSTYRYRVRAIDQEGNLSPYSAIADATTTAAPDTSPPTAPTGLTATAISTSRIDLSWTASTDNVGVTEYRIERCQGTNCTSFAQIGTSPTTSFSSTGLSANTNYRFRVRAVDAAGNLGPYSSIVTRRTLAPDTTRPTAPTGLTAAAISTSRIDLSWTASTDNIGVTGYQVQRCQGTSCTSFAQIGTSTTTSFSSTGLSANTSYRFRVRAVDAAGNLSTFSNIAAATTPAIQDTAPPTDPASLTATAVGSSRIDLAWPASTDNVSVSGYRVERCQGAGCTNFAQVATPTANSHSDTGLAPSSTYRYRVRAADPSGNLSGYSPIAEATTGAASSTPPGLVGAWGFEEGAGPTTADSSGSGNTGTLIGAAWTTQGRYGGALSFDGSSSMVRVADSASLDLSSAMTLSAWIRPSAAQSGWRTILQREVDAYFLNASNTDGPLRPSGGGTFGGAVQYLSGPTANPVDAWTHVALSYDGANLRLFINGTQAAIRTMSGAIQTNNNPLWIGGNSPYGEYFQGLIDEVRVYGRALSQADVQADMNAAVSAAP